MAASFGSLACTRSTHDGSSNAAVTDIPESPVKDQGQTGNCWLYATGAWIESVRSEVPDNPDTDYSPAYWDYWDWYAQILGGATNIAFGGYWGRAVDIVRHYGMVPMNSFVPDDVQGALDANTAINAALATGPLSAPDALLDPVQVLAALNAAFKLSPTQIAQLVATFGADGKNTFDANAVATPGFAITRAQDILVETPVPGGPVVATTLDQLIGLPSPDGQPDDRIGQYAWTAVYPPQAPIAPSGTPGVYGQIPRSTSGAPASDSDADVTADAGTDEAGDDSGPGSNDAAWRAFQIRLQTALNAGAPLPIAWVVVDPDLNDTTGEFSHAVNSVDYAAYGYHESLIADYQATNVPGFGTLLAGTVATAPQLAASLDPSAQITFFRIKNSWGSFAPAAPQPGYDDLDTAYLDTGVTVTYPQGSFALPNLISDVVVPAGF